MNLSKCLRVGAYENISAVNKMPRVAQIRGRLWILLAAALMLMVLGQSNQADATVIHVNTTVQGVTNGKCSLQEAIYSSEFQANRAIGATDPDSPYTTGCEPGTGDDTIELPANAVFKFDHFWDGDAHNISGPTATPVIISKIAIEGNRCKRWRWTGTGNSRLFTIAIVNVARLSLGRHRGSDAQERRHQGVPRQRAAMGVSWAVAAVWGRVGQFT